jgi:hypothetical protein
MPRSHARTLEYLLRLVFENSFDFTLVSFLAELARESQINKMGPDNIAVVFAPTLMRMELVDPFQALQEVKISQKILIALLLKKMENNLSREFSSLKTTGEGRNTRLGKVIR